MEAIEPILVELEKMVRLLSIIALRDGKQRENILLLSRAGFQPKEIAQFLGTSSNTVRVELTNLKKGRRKHGSKREVKS